MSSETRFNDRKQRIINEMNYEDQILDQILDELSSSVSNSSSYNLTNDSLGMALELVGDNNNDLSSLEELTVNTPTSNNEGDSTTQINEKDSRNTNNNRKKRKYHVNNISRNKKYLRIPRIVNSDIRKKYPIMLINALNSCNYNYMKEFLYLVTDRNTSAAWTFTRYRDHLTDHHHHLHLTDHNPLLTQLLPQYHSQLSDYSGKRSWSIEFQQINEICNYIFHSSLSIPDRIYQIINCEILTRSDSFETRIVIDFRMTGTKSYHSNPLKAAVFVQNFSQESSFQDESDEESSLVKLFYQNMARIESPRPMLSEGRIILIVENYRESMKINKMLFEATSNQARFRDPPRTT